MLQRALNFIANKNICVCSNAPMFCVFCGDFVTKVTTIEKLELKHANVQAKLIDEHFCGNFVAWDRMQ